MIQLSRHISTILAQIRYVTRHAASADCRADNLETIKAMRDIVAEMRAAADSIETIAQRYEAVCRERIERNAALYSSNPEGN